jgi:hypothetical protein
MSDFYPGGLFDLRPTELPSSAVLHNADIQLYQTVEDLLQQKRQAHDRQIALSKSYASASPEERRAIETEIKELSWRIQLLHKEARERNAVEIENLLRPSPPEHLSGQGSPKYETDSLQSSEELELDSNDEYVMRVHAESEIMRAKISDRLLAQKAAKVISSERPKKAATHSKSSFLMRPIHAVKNTIHSAFGFDTADPNVVEIDFPTPDSTPDSTPVSGDRIISTRTAQDHGSVPATTDSSVTGTKPSPALRSPHPSKVIDRHSDSQTTTKPSGFKTSSLIIGSGVTVALIALMGWAWSRFKKRQSQTPTDRRSHSREWNVSESS